ncbi:MAG TPA: DNA-processing protein DprA [Elusimicrobiales bacterium]|nr:DNA-processing protein DprA [Elusimicrobiales bacterium]
MNKAVTENEKLARIKINAFSYMRSDWCGRLINVFGSAENVLKATTQDISQNGAVSIETAEKFLSETSKFDARAELDKVSNAGGSILTAEDENYPESLKDIPHPPIILYVKGTLKPERVRVAMVGTRRPSRYGIKTATLLSRDLALCKITVVSGMARGIDSVAHKAVIDLKEITWAVLGTGLGKCYPAENKKLASEIIDNGGALITEIPFERGPMAFHFPRRNRIIAGLSYLTVVVEGPIKSGALITAKQALEQGKEVLAVPGPIDSPTSEGPNSLIRDGAGIVTSALDIVYHIPLQYKPQVSTQELENRDKQNTDVSVGKNLSEDEKAVFNCIGQQCLNLDEISCKLDWSVPKVSAVLFELEANSILTCNTGKYEKKI